MSRQQHGFNFESTVIEKYSLRKSVQYLAHFDALTQDDIPVQIKIAKDKSEICLGSFSRNLEISRNFVLYIGIWKNEKNNIVREISLFIDHKKWIELITSPNYETIINEFMDFSNLKEDDERYKNFVKNVKKEWGDRPISLRFKRDHKTQKRIQLAIPFKKLDEIITLFKEYSFNEKIKEEKNDMEKITITEAKELDKFYTKPKMAKKIVKTLTKEIDISKYGGFLEPSAGNGSFLKYLSKFNLPILAVDIKPEGDDIEEADFLIDDLILPEGRVIAIGNPPFGKMCSKAIKFFNRCAKYIEIDIIAFILPCSFRKESIQDKLDRNFHLLADYDMDSQSFLLCNLPYEVPCCFMIWERRKDKRPLSLRFKPKNFEYVDYENSNLSIRRVGVKAGFCFIPSETIPAKSSHYFIKFNIENFDIEDFIIQFNNLTWEKNDTVGPRSISKNILTREINILLDNLILN